MSSLTSKTCTPCRGGVPPLTRDEAEEMHAETPAWSLTDGATKIERNFRFPDFAGAMAFVQRIGELAEGEGHHPDLCFGWGYCRVVLYTHKLTGLHPNDFILAAKIDQLPVALKE